MSFLQTDAPGNNQANSSANAGAVSDAQNQANASSTNADVTVTTDEGSTLHTSNDPALRKPPAISSHGGTPIGQAQDNSPSNDPLSFQPGNNLATNPASQPDSTADSPADTLAPLTAPDSGSTTSSGSTQRDSIFDPNLNNTSSNPELDNIKYAALEQLRPLLEKVDLPAAEKFDKYLMMLRATDDSSLIEPAFTAAQGIEDEKEKAEALVDIINEINYVSSDHSNE